MDKIKRVLTDPRIFLFIAPLILMSPVYITGRAFFWGTSATQFVPWWDFAWKSIISGQSPLWNPLVGMGAPLAANYQSALFYPPTWLYFIVYILGGTTWMAWAISLVVCGHLIWSGAGMAILLREFGTSKFGQALGGLAFSLSGYLVARAGFLSINAAAAWIPWLLMYLYQLAKKEKNAVRKLTGVIAMLFLAGHAQTAWIAIMLGAIWIAYLSVLKSNDNKLKNFGRSLAGYLGSGLLAAGISAIQLIPTAEYLLVSQRSGEYGIETAMTYSFWPWRFLTLLVPDLFGNPGTANYWGYGNYWEDAVYIGLFPSLLAFAYLIWSMVKVIRKEKGEKTKKSSSLGIFLGGIILASFLLALGDNTAIFPFLYRIIPGFDLFQAPTRYSIMAVLSLSLLAGLGADRLTKPSGRRLYFARLAVAGSFSIFAGAIIANQVFPEIKSSFLVSVGRAGLIALLVSAAYLVLPERDQPRRTQAWVLAVICLLSLDLISAGWNLNPGIDKEFYAAQETHEIDGRAWMPSDVEYELKFNTFFTFESFYPQAEWAELHHVHLPNVAMLQGIEMVNNFDPILPWYYQDWMDWINTEFPEQKIQELMNLNSIIKLSETELTEMVQLDLGKNPVRVTGCAGISSKEERNPDSVMTGGINPVENIIVVSEDPIPCVPGAKGRVDIVEERNGYLKLNVDSNQDGWVFWSQSWFPGWMYKRDGAKMGETYRVNYVFQGVPVSKGTQMVEFLYRPVSFYVGGILTAVSLALGGVMLLFQNRRKEG